MEAILVRQDKRNNDQQILRVFKRLSLRVFTQQKKRVVIRQSLRVLHRLG